jgi:uncharacterized membrane protein YoaK (UPF0700 family)
MSIVDTFLVVFVIPAICFVVGVVCGRLIERGPCNGS